MAYQPPSNPPPGGYYPPPEQGGYYPPPEGQQGGYYPPNGGQQGGYYPPPGGQQGGYYPPQGYDPAYAAPPPKKAKKILDPRTAAHKKAKTAALADIVISGILIAFVGISIGMAKGENWYVPVGLVALYIGSIVVSILILIQKSDKKKKILIIIWMVLIAIRIVAELGILIATIVLWYNKEPIQTTSDHGLEGLVDGFFWFIWITQLIIVLGIYGAYIAFCFMMAACLKQINKDLRGEGDPPVPDANERMMN